MSDRRVCSRQSSRCRLFSVSGGRKRRVSRRRSSQGVSSRTRGGERQLDEGGRQNTSGELAWLRSGSNASRFCEAQITRGFLARKHAKRQRADENRSLQMYAAAVAASSVLIAGCRSIEALLDAKVATRARKSALVAASMFDGSSRSAQVRPPARRRRLCVAKKTFVPRANCNRLRKRGCI